MVKKALTYEAGLARAAGLCARGEHSGFEMRRKLLQWGADAEIARKIVGWLEENGFIDESRFAKSFVHDKYRFDGWGRIKIRYTLGQHGVVGQVADEALQEIDDAEYRSNLQVMLRAKFCASNEKNPYKLKALLFRYAMSRGYEPDYIAPVVAGLVAGADDFDSGVL